MSDDELIEAMHEAMYDDGCPGAVDSMHAVLAVVRAHDSASPTALANSGPKERQEAFDALKEELDDALAELAALRAHDRDAERMKWLADYMVEIEYEPTPEETVCIWLLMNKELRRERYETSDLRAAIDAAMRAEG